MSYTHAADRALQHYGYELTWAAYRRLCRSCKLGRTLLLGKQPNGRERHLVRLEEQILNVIYDTEHGSIVTVEPRGRKPLGFFAPKLVRSRARKRRQMKAVDGG